MINRNVKRFPERDLWLNTPMTDGSILSGLAGYARKCLLSEVPGYYFDLFKVLEGRFHLSTMRFPFMYTDTEDLFYFAAVSRLKIEKVDLYFSFKYQYYSRNSRDNAKVRLKNKRLDAWMKEHDRKLKWLSRRWDAKRMETEIQKWLLEIKDEYRKSQNL